MESVDLNFDKLVYTACKIGTVVIQRMVKIRQNIILLSKEIYSVNCLYRWLRLENHDRNYESRLKLTKTRRVQALTCTNRRSIFFYIL